MEWGTRGKGDKQIAESPLQAYPIYMAMDNTWNLTHILIKIGSSYELWTAHKMDPMVWRRIT